jgi:phosphoenolpyruvate carboxykinase (GTP)
MSPPPAHLTDWRGNDWAPGAKTPAAHPNARFTAPASQCPVIAKEWEDPAGVPISAILFGGRRATVTPLVYESRDWAHGTFVGSIVSSEMTAAAAGTIGQLRRDPMAMLPFCGYDMADYWGHWLAMGRQAGAKMPRIFSVNWFRKGADGKFLWPGFGENIRVLAWVFERCAGKTPGRETAIGVVPTTQELDRTGLNVTADDLEALLRVETEGWLTEIPMIREYYALFGEKLPAALAAELDRLEARLRAAQA